MSTSARLILIVCAALLSACASRPQPAPVAAKPKPVFNYSSQSSPVAEDVLFRALGWSVRLIVGAAIRRTPVSIAAG